MRYTISLLLASAAMATTAGAEVPRVVTDIPPVHSLAAQVMGDLGAPVLLLDAGADAHNFQLRPSQAAALAEADLVVWVGPEMTPWLDRSLDGLSPEGARLGLLAAEGTFTRSYGEAEAGHDHGHDHAEEGHAHEGHDHSEDDHAHAGDDHGHAHDGLDPHAWLDPANGRHWLGLIAAELSRLDPANAATYAANAQAASERITALDADLKARLAPVKGTPFVVFHDAYGYFADHYGLTVAGAVAEGDAAAPGAAHLSELAARLGSGGALCLFPEAQHDPALVTTLAADSGVRLGDVLDPEGSSLTPGPDLYAGLLMGMADTLLACLSSS